MNKILFVDEDRDILELYKERFEKKYSVVVTNSPVVAVEGLNDIDLLVTDVIFDSSFSGRLYVDCIKYHDYKGGIIFVTTCTNFVRNYDCPILQKPFRFEKLEELIEDYFKFKNGLGGI